MASDSTIHYLRHRVTQAVWQYKETTTVWGYLRLTTGILSSTFSSVYSLTMNCFKLTYCYRSWYSRDWSNEIVKRPAFSRLSEALKATRIEKLIRSSYVGAAAERVNTGQSDLVLCRATLTATIKLKSGLRCI